MLFRCYCHTDATVVVMVVVALLPLDWTRLLVTRTALRMHMNQLEV